MCGYLLRFFELLQLRFFVLNFVHFFLLFDNSCLAFDIFPFLLLFVFFLLFLGLFFIFLLRFFNWRCFWKLCLLLGLSSGSCCFPRLFKRISKNFFSSALLGGSTFSYFAGGSGFFSIFCYSGCLTSIFESSFKYFSIMKIPWLS